MALRALRKMCMRRTAVSLSVSELFKSLEGLKSLCFSDPNRGIRALRLFRLIPEGLQQMKRGSVGRTIQQTISKEASEKTERISPHLSFGTASLLDLHRDCVMETILNSYLLKGCIKILGVYRIYYNTFQTPFLR